MHRLIGLGVLLAVISRSAVPAVALGAFGLVLDWLWAQAMVLLVMRDASALSVPRWLLPDGLVGDLYRWSINYNGTGVAFSNALAGAVKPVAGIDASAGALAMRLLPTTPERALWIVLGYVLLTGSAAAWLVVRRDVTR